MTSPKKPLGLPVPRVLRFHGSLHSAFSNLLKILVDFVLFMVVFQLLVQLELSHWATLVLLHSVVHHIGNLAKERTFFGVREE